MTLKPYTSDQIGVWEDRLLEAAGDLKKIRDGMKSAGMETVPLEAKKALMYIDYLINWSITSEARFRQQRAQQSVEDTRSRVKKKKKKKRS